MLKKNKVIKNASWILFGKILQSVFGIIVTMLTTRFFGPSNYGIINYATAIVSFVTPIAQLGLNSTIVHEIINSEEDKECGILGTAIIMNILSSLLCIFGIFVFVSFANKGDIISIIICVLYSISLLFQSLELIQYWFQAKLLSKYSSIVMFIAYAITAAYKIILLLFGQNLYLYAISNSLDYAIISIVLILIYRKMTGNKLKFSYQLIKPLLKNSKYYIISGLMVTIFAQTDKIMIKLMVDDEATGLYSAATAMVGLTTFIFTAFINSAMPDILEKKKSNDKAGYDRTLTLLYSIVIYLAIFQSIIITIFPSFFVKILYGDDYLSCVNTLVIVVWYTAFSYVGAVRDIWLLAEKKQRYLVAINAFGAFLNLTLNYFLISQYEIVGAAIATLITQISTNVVIGFILKPIRPNNRLLLKSLNPVVIINVLRKPKKTRP